MNIFRRFIDWVTGRYRIRTIPVQVGQRVLKYKWTLETAEDLRILHSIDTEAAMIAFMKQELLNEIDRTGQRLPVSTFEEENGTAESDRQNTQFHNKDRMEDISVGYRYER